MLGGLNCLRYLLKYDEGKRKPAVRAQDVHDILVPLFRGRTDAAKDEACKALRLLISDVSWTEAAAPVFEKLGVGSGKLYSLVNEMNARTFSFCALLSAGGIARGLRRAVRQARRDGPGRRRDL